MSASLNLVARRLNTPLGLSAPAYVACCSPMFTNFGAIRNGSTVKVYMGADWQRGTVKSTSPSFACVQLTHRIVTVYDLRNIKPS